MATSWTSVNIGSHLSGDDAQEAMPQGVWDILKASLRMGATVPLGSIQSGTSTAWVSASSVDVRIPLIARVGEKLQIWFFLESSAAATLYGRVRETGVPTNGTEASYTFADTSDPDEAVSSEITIASGWPGTVKTFELQSRGNGTNYSVATTKQRYQVQSTNHYRHLMCNFKITD